MCIVHVFCIGELSVCPNIQANSVGVIKPGESFTYTDEVHTYMCSVYIYRSHTMIHNICFKLYTIRMFIAFIMIFCYID